MSEEIDSHIAERYEIIKKLGKGAYGVVWKALDTKTNKVIALKKVYDAFQNATDAQRTYREVMYLQQLNGHENIVRLLSILRANNNKDLYLVFEIMETDLHIVIRAKILKDIHKKFIIYQLFKALKYLHSADLVHRDLKPSNMLINSDCVMKLADFGLARSVAFDHEGEPPIVSDYIATRWYRAPEIVLGSKCYTKAVDMWSAGCILAEILLEKVLFSGKSSLNQMELIIKLLGRPNDEELKEMKISHTNDLISNLNTKKSQSMSNLFKGCDKDAVDLIRKLLIYKPNKRITIEESLKHPFFRKFHNPKEEIICPKKIVIPIDDNEKLSLKAYRDAIYQNISIHIKNQVNNLKSVNLSAKSHNSKMSLKAKNNFIKKKKSKIDQKRIATKKVSRSLEAKYKANYKSSSKQKIKQNKNLPVRKKNKSEDHKQYQSKNKFLSETTKINKKIQISKSKMYADHLKFKKTLMGNKMTKEKGFFKKKTDVCHSQKLIKKNLVKSKEGFDYQNPLKSSSNFKVVRSLARKV